MYAMYAYVIHRDSRSYLQITSINLSIIYYLLKIKRFLYSYIKFYIRNIFIISIIF